MTVGTRHQGAFFIAENGENAMFYQTEKFRNNPCVSFVDYSKLELTTEFRIQLFNTWKANGKEEDAITELLTDNNLGSDLTGRKFAANLSRTFEKNGYPVADRLERKQEGFVETNPLVLSGAYVYAGKGNGNGITMSDGLKERIQAGYPEKGIKEMLTENSVDPADVGSIRIERLENEIKKKKQDEAERNRVTLPGDEKKLDEKERQLKRLSDNPYVSKAEEKWSEIKITMSERFYEDAYPLFPLGINKILEIYGIDPELFSRNTLSYMSAKIFNHEQRPTVSGRKPGPSPQVLEIGFSRADAMDRLIEVQFIEIGRSFDGIKVNQKRRICSWIDGLPRDPQGYYTKGKILELMGIKRSTYYEILENENYGMSEKRLADQDELDYGIIKTVMDYKGFEKGIRQIYMLMPRITSCHMSMNRIRRIMRRYGMRTTIRRPHGHRKGALEMVKRNKKANLLLQKFRLHRPNEVRLTDVTYLDYGDGKRAYGSCSVDPVSGMIIAFVVSEKNDLKMALDTLDEMDRHPAVKGALLHSDQGTLYMTDDFQNAVKERGYRQSMSKRGYCWDNAPEESFHGHFKDECHYKECSTIEELRELVDKYVVYYNTERGRWDHDGMTPAEYEKYLLDLDDEAFSLYLEKETAKYEKMKADAAARAVEKARIEQEEHRRQMEEYDVEQAGKEE